MARGETQGRRPSQSTLGRLFNSTLDGLVITPSLVQNTPGHPRPTKKIDPYFYLICGSDQVRFPAPRSAYTGAVEVANCSPSLHFTRADRTALFISAGSFLSSPLELHSTSIAEKLHRFGKYVVQLVHYCPVGHPQAAMLSKGSRESGRDAGEEEREEEQEEEERRRQV